MNDDEISRRKPRRYVPSYDYAAGLLRFSDIRRRGRPKLSHKLKSDTHERKISLVLIDIWRLNLTTVKSYSWIAKRLHAKFPDKYLPDRKTQVGRTIKSSLRKDVAEAMKYLGENAARPNMHPGFIRLLEYQKQREK
jgi:hypothetical protein